jgi:hypothetical protein
LQTWLVAALNVLDDARAELGSLEYEVLLDIVACRLARDYIARLGVLDAPDESEAA